MEASHAKRRLYHSRAARDDRDGAFPLQKGTSGKLSRCACSRRGSKPLDSAKAVRPIRASLLLLCSGLSPLLAAAPRFLQ